jgi:hypothetical protein
MQPGQRIHESVFDKINRDHSYRPKARPYGSFDWDSINDLRNVLIEEDPYTKFAKFLEEITNSIFEMPDQELDVRIASVESGEYRPRFTNLSEICIVII